jgi:pimeloyl-ACP methyl ester carboxylesterase
MAQVSFTTSDQVAISASWVLPKTQTKSSKPRPAVILLHDYGLDRRDWGIFIPDLVEQGYNVLAIDMRGHGQSSGGGAASPMSMMQTGYRDVEAALTWVASQKTSNAKKISLIGIGMGADIAYLCSGQFYKEIETFVAISPSHNPVTHGSFIDREPRSILFCVTRKGKQGKSMFAAETLSNFTKEPKKLVVYDSAAYGLAMFYKHPEIKQEIFAWLSR